MQNSLFNWSEFSAFYTEYITLFIGGIKTYISDMAPTSNKRKSLKANGSIGNAVELYRVQSLEKENDDLKLEKTGALQLTSRKTAKTAIGEEPYRDADFHAPTGCVRKE
uniref:Uncharacterized protein n=1 Tax=Caenorhabditis japonica TaxID=281687 RepID=A0A8R1E357_CAEJA